MTKVIFIKNYIALMEAIIEQAKRDSVKGQSDARWFLESDFKKSMELWINWYHHRKKPDSYSAAIPD